jgi:hypothetical protein
MSVISRRVTGRFDAWGQRLIAEMSDRLEATVAESVRSEMRELARMLRQQGDAADEMAETFGRTLARLSVAVENLHARLEALDGGGAGRTVDGSPAEHP